MELVNQHTKSIMEGCKVRARDAGLRFEDETLEYVVTNRDLLELSPKIMIPTLYDYWVHDVEVLKGKGRYELYPNNPYETVINTRPAISYYNDNNPDWLNVMIFYHVLAHIDFFQNNLYFRHTWDYDFTGQALSDKRVISKLRSEHGHFVEYVIEFSRGIDNLVGYFSELDRLFPVEVAEHTARINYYFDIFLQSVRKVKTNEYIKEIERYNQCMTDQGTLCEDVFFAEVDRRYPEFKAMLTKYKEKKSVHSMDLLQYILENSSFLNKEENKWMKTIVEVVRNTSLFFQPQIRTKIMNEGWASYWHEKLFMEDERIRGHEIEFARAHAGVTAMPRVGMNPYALGMRLFQHLEEMADQGRMSFDFERLRDRHQRQTFDADLGAGKQTIFAIRENLSDFLFINRFIDQDFVDRYRLFVADRRLNRERGTWEIYVKSRKAEDYRKMVLDSLYHPPSIEVVAGEPGETLKLDHRFEGKPLIGEYLANTLMGIEFLWGAPVQLETSEVERERPTESDGGWGAATASEPGTPRKLRWQRVSYTMKERQLSRYVLGAVET